MQAAEHDLQQVVRNMKYSFRYAIKFQECNTKMSLPGQALF